MAENLQLHEVVDGQRPSDIATSRTHGGFSTKAKMVFCTIAGAFIAGCLVFGIMSMPPAGVASSVGGKNIMESDVTKYVDRVRAAQGLTDDDAWKEYMTQNSTSAANIRQQAIQQLQNNVVYDLAAEDIGIKATDEEISAKFDEAKSMYGNDETFKEYLEKVGMSESDYKNQIRMSVLMEKINDALADKVEVTDDDIVDYVNSTYDIPSELKHFYLLSYKTDDASALAQVEKLNSGEISYKQLAEAVLGSVEEADCGWVDATTLSDSKVKSALTTLNKGQISEPIDSGDGTSLLIMWDESLPLNSALSSVNDMSESAITYFRDLIKENKASASYNNYMTDFYYGLTVTTYSMPKGLSYDI